MKWLAIFLLGCALLSCSEAPIQEYFCETDTQMGASHYYKQHIVQLSHDSFCLLGLVEFPVCAKYNQAMTSPWHLQDSKTQVREFIQVKLSKEHAIMDIDQESQPAGSEPSLIDSAHAHLHFEFEKKSLTLSVNSGDDKAPFTFACKPWTKRAWWQIY